MVPSYTITVQNDSSMRQTYNITQEPPRVDNLSGKSWPIVIDQARVPPQDSGKFEIDIPDPYYAYALSSQRPLEHGTNATIISQVPVKVGSKDGSRTPGSNIKYVVDDWCRCNCASGWVGHVEKCEGQWEGWSWEALV